MKRQHPSIRLRHESMEIRRWWCVAIVVHCDRPRWDNSRICHRISSATPCPPLANISHVRPAMAPVFRYRPTVECPSIRRVWFLSRNVRWWCRCHSFWHDWWLHIMQSNRFHRTLAILSCCVASRNRNSTCQSQKSIRWHLCRWPLDDIDVGGRDRCPILLMWWHESPANHRKLKPIEMSNSSVQQTSDNKPHSVNSRCPDDVRSHVLDCLLSQRMMPEDWLPPFVPSFSSWRNEREKIIVSSTCNTCVCLLLAKMLNLFNSMRKFNNFSIASTHQRQFRCLKWTYIGCIPRHCYYSSKFTENFRFWLATNRPLELRNTIWQNWR